MTLAYNALEANLTQTLKAATALLAHIRKEQESKSKDFSKKNLLDEAEGSSDDDEDADEDSGPISLILTTKKFIVDKTRLKPGKMSVMTHHSVLNVENG